VTEPRSFSPTLLGGDRDLEVLRALARAEARLNQAEQTGIGIEEAEEARAGAYASALVFFTQGPT
jgi:hypothetical protein